jgi:hypothetical protein
MRKATHNSLGPRHLSTWLVVPLISGLWIIAFLVQKHFQLTNRWFAVTAYLILLFGTVVSAFRPAWGKRAFWLGAGVLFALHLLAGLGLVLFPVWLEALHSFLTLVVVADLLLTMSILWRFTVAHSH